MGRHEHTMRCIKAYVRRFFEDGCLDERTGNLLGDKIRVAVYEGWIERSP